MTIFNFIVLIPLLSGIGAAFIPRYMFKYGGAIAAISAITVILGGISGLPFFETFYKSGHRIFYADTFSLILVIITGLCGLLVSLYNTGHMNKYPGFIWSIYCWLFSFSAAVFISGDIKYLTLFWILTGLMSALIAWEIVDKAAAVKILKSVLLEGLILLLGLVALWFRMEKNIFGNPVEFSGLLDWVIFLSFIYVAFMKVGIISNKTERIPLSTAAFISTVLDKLLGVYLLKKVIVDWFVLSPTANVMLLSIGGVIVVCGAYKAFESINLRKTLQYQTLSLTGYVFIGLGVGSNIGIASALFQILNIVFFQFCLMLSAGIIKKEAGTLQLDELGGISGSFPFVFISFALCSMASAGLPFSSGFISRWLLYYGLIHTEIIGGYWIFWLAIALFGSLFLLMSFIKIIHAVFLGQSSSVRGNSEHLKWELPAILFFPICSVVAGLFPDRIIYPVLQKISGGFEAPGMFNIERAGLLLLTGMVFGYLIYLITGTKHYRIAEPYTGGSKISEHKINLTQFYSIKEYTSFVSGFLEKIKDIAVERYRKFILILKK
jgi:formate hydrogenlyase subunit 3/multisubunit Na+/H+ antiporter MnhD subunit